MNVFVRVVTLSTLLIILLSGAAQAQELKASVSVNAPSLKIIDPVVIEQFEQSVEEFLNTTRFTNLEMELEERIECNFTFNLDEQSELDEKSFNAQMIVQTIRPVYGSSYKTTVFTFQDNALIEYEQYQPLDYSETTFSSSLVSLLSFYANIIIGLDMDTFSPAGGDPYYARAQEIVNIVPKSVVNRDKAWGPNGGTQARHSLLLELQNPRIRPYRQMLYDYHRKGLDVMASDAVAGRVVMGESLKALKEVRADIPRSILLNSFTTAKQQELLEVFIPAPQQERSAVYDIISDVAPSSLSRYRALR